MNPERYENIALFTGTDSESGPKSILLVGVHGDERPPITAYNELRDKLTIEQGALFVGYGNPRAIWANQRKVEADLNRMFKPESDLTESELASYERQRAQHLIPYLNQSEVLLDVHATKNPQGVPFIIAEPNSAEITSRLPIDNVVSGFDEHEPGGTDYYMNSIGHAGICAETGYKYTRSTVLLAKDVILAFLQTRGHISGMDVRRIQNNYRVFHLYRTETNFTRARHYRDFEKIEEGQKIGIDGEKTVSADRDSVILFGNKDYSTPKEDAFLLAEAVKQTES